MGPLFSIGLLFLGSMACLAVSFVVFRFFLGMPAAFVAACMFVSGGVCGLILAGAVLSLFMPNTLASSSEVIVYLLGTTAGGLIVGGAASWAYVRRRRFNSTIDPDAMHGSS
jgi:hypothetical protein